MGEECTVQEEKRCREATATSESGLKRLSLAPPPALFALALALALREGQTPGAAAAAQHGGQTGREQQADCNNVYARYTSAYTTAHCDALIGPSALRSHTRRPQQGQKVWLGVSSPRSPAWALRRAQTISGAIKEIVRTRRTVDKLELG